MTATTKKVLVLALIAVIVAGSLLSYLMYQIDAKGTQLEEQIAILNESTSKESAFVRLTRLAQETTDERAILASAFFADESESITFLGEVEALAASLNLTLETEGLDKITKEGSTQEFIRMTFVYEGQRDTVFSFSKLFEVIPYHSVVESLQLQETSPGNWQGTITVLITIQKP